MTGLTSSILCKYCVVFMIFVISHSNASSCHSLNIIPSGSSHHHRLSLNREGRWGTTDDIATRFLQFSQFFTALWDLANSRPVHSVMSSHLFLCLPCLAEDWAQNTNWLITSLSPSSMELSADASWPLGLGELSVRLAAHCCCYLLVYRNYSN